MINSYGKMLKAADNIVYTQYYSVKIFLLEQLAKKGVDVLSDTIKEEVEQIKIEI